MYRFFINRFKKITTVGAFAFVFVFTLLIYIVKYFGIKEDYRYIRVEVIKKNWVENYSPYGYRVPFWLSDKIKIGQTEKNSAGMTTAEVINFENYVRGGEESEIYLILKIKAVLNSKTGRYTYKDLPIDLGSAIDLNINTINIKGQIVDDNYPVNGYPTKYFTVVARSRNLSSSISSQLKTGLKMFNLATKDAIAEITNIRLVPSTLQEATINQSKSLVFNQEKNQDAIITLKIKAYQIDNRWFFSGHQNLKIGNDEDVRIDIFTDKINLYGLEIEQINEF